MVALTAGDMFRRGWVLSRRAMSRVVSEVQYTYGKTGIYRKFSDFRASSALPSEAASMPFGRKMTTLTF
jgi:hypothetical protein